MNRIAIVSGVALLAMAAGSAWGKEFAKPERPPPTPMSESHMQRDGFDGMLLVTPDKDWREKWNTPPETAPHFRSTTEVSDGGELWVLAFFSNPGLDAEGRADITCDVQLLRPDGSRAQDVVNQPCFRHARIDNPRMVYLADVAIGVLAEASDPRGEWIARITLRDGRRKVELPLQTRFTIR